MVNVKGLVFLKKKIVHFLVSVAILETNKGYRNLKVKSVVSTELCQEYENCFWKVPIVTLINSS